MHVRRCKGCGEEYRPEVVTCVDCGGPLEDADDELVPFEARQRPGATPETAPAPRQPPEGYVTVYVARDLREVHPLVDCLEEREVPFHVQEQPGERGYSASAYLLMVPEAEAALARRSIGPLLGEGSDPEAVDRGFDAETGYGQCPACSAAIPPQAPACPECGLGVAGEDEQP